MDATLEILAAGPPGAAGRSAPQVTRVEAARQFEAYMLKLLLGQMRKTVSDGGLFQDRTSAVYQSMFDDALATRAAERGAFGLAEQMLRQWQAQSPEARP